MAWTKRVTTKDGEPRYKVFFYDPGGSQRSKTFVKSEDARRFERTVEVDKDRGSYSDPNRGKITLRELAGGFMASRSAGGDGLRPSSVALYEMHLRRYIAPALGDRRLNAISKADVSEFETGLRSAGTGAPTVEAVHRLLRAVRLRHRRRANRPQPRDPNPRGAQDAQGEDPQGSLPR